MKDFHWRLIPFILFILLAAFLWRGLSLDPQKLPSTRLDKLLPKFRLQSLSDPKTLLTETRLKGNVALLNVWASWCEACIEEQVLLMSLAEEGIVIYGLNYKDKASHARQWLAEWGNPYKMVGLDVEGKVGIDLGVYGAPETFLIDRDGVVRYRHVGVLTAHDWKRDFLPRMQALEKSYANND